MQGYSEIERKLMAHTGRLQLYQVVVMPALHAIDKKLAYAYAYGGFRYFQARVDEEGCGAVYAAGMFSDA